MINPNPATPPDFRRLLIRALGEDDPSRPLPGLAERQIQLLGQKVAFDVSDMAIEEAERLNLGPITTDESPLISLALALAKVRVADDDLLVLVKFSKRPSAVEWRWEGHRMMWPHDLSSMPYVGLAMVDVRGLDLGLFTTGDEIATIRLTLADGTIVESGVSNGATVLQALYAGPGAWSDLGIIEHLDRNSRIILRETIWTSPYPPPELFEQGGGSCLRSEA